MRRFLTLMIFVLFVCLAQMSQARSLALLIGVNDYQNVPSLKTCVNDAHTLKETLMKKGFEEKDIRVLVTGGSVRDLPTKMNIEQSISELVSVAEPSDFVFIAFSGQGFQNGKYAYICPPNADINDLEGTSISIEKILNILSSGRAKRNLIVIDACRNKINTEHRGILPLTSEIKVITQSSTSQEIAIFHSCSAGEVCYEEADINVGNGYFTKNLAAALSGEADCNNDGRLTLLEVVAWTANQTQLQVQETLKQSQRPSLSGTISDFVLAENKNVAKAQTLVEEAQKALDSEDYALAIEKFDAAIALYPNVSFWKRDRELAQKMKEMKEQLSSKSQDD